MGTPSARAARLLAFLRAINVGGHNVRMDRLRELFEALGLSNVETFIASGNVIFDSPATNSQVLEKEIEDHLRESLGYEVATFIRSASELRAIASHRPFEASELDREAREKLSAFRTEFDDFHIHGREVYWLCRTKMSESAFSGALLEKTIGMPATMRNATTIKRLATKYPPTE